MVPVRHATSAGDVAQLRSLLDPALDDRGLFGSGDDRSAKHLLIVVDDPDADPNALVPRGGLAGVTLVHRITEPPHREQYADPERPILRVVGRQARALADRRLAPYVDAADHLDVATARHVARRLSRWDSNPSHARTSNAGVADVLDAAGHSGRRGAGRRESVGAARACRRAAGAHRRDVHRRTADTSTSRTRPRAAWARTA